MGDLKLKLEPWHFVCGRDSAYDTVGIGVVFSTVAVKLLVWDFVIGWEKL